MTRSELLPLLQRLDQLLDRAVSEANIVYGDKAADDPYRGLHVEEEEVERSLSREPAIPLFPQAAAIPFPSDLVAPGSRLAWLQATFDLSNFDLDIAAIALAPELDRRYERLYAYLQDDVRCKQPRVDLVLNLLCPDAAAKLARRDRFSPDAPPRDYTTHFDLGMLHLFYSKQLWIQIKKLSQSPSVFYTNFSGSARYCLGFFSRPEHFY